MDWQRVFDFFFPPQCAVCRCVGMGLCEQCVPSRPFIFRRLATLSVCAVGTYDGDLRRAILSVKHGRRDVARAAAERLAVMLEPRTVIVPVPTTSWRRLERGFDGCVLMARHAAKISNACMLHGLVQVRGDRQRGRSRSARLGAHGRFAWRAERLDGMAITLLDDVVTTGATLEDCAAVLRAAGATVTNAIALAIAP